MMAEDPRISAAREALAAENRAIHSTDPDLPDWTTEAISKRHSRLWHALTGLFAYVDEQVSP